MEGKKNRIGIKILGLLGLFFLVFGISYALFQVTLNGTKKTKISVGQLSLKLTDKDGHVETDGFDIDLEDAYPMYDSEGLEGPIYEFHIVNDGTINADYKIYLDDEDIASNLKLDPSNIRYGLKVGDHESAVGTLSDLGDSPNRIIHSGRLNRDKTLVVKLQLWLDIEAENSSQGKLFSGKIRVEATQSNSVFPQGSLADEVFVSYGKNMKRLGSKINNGFDSTTEESGLYEYTDEEGTTVYPFRGTTLGNYVSFADQTWRILSLYKDGTIKLVRAESLSYTNPMYVTEPHGSRVLVTYGDAQSNFSSHYNNSYVKRYVEAWYNDIMIAYDTKIKQTNYCNDFYENPDSQYAKEKSDKQIFGLYNRMIYTDINDKSTYQFSPNFTCSSGEIYSGKTALLTIDEYILAGGSTEGGNFYLYDSGINNWTMSPISSSPGDRLYIFGSRVTDLGAEGKSGVKPVIVLNSNLTIKSGNGTSSNPYVIE